MRVRSAGHGLFPATGAILLALFLFLAPLVTAGPAPAAPATDPRIVLLKNREYAPALLKGIREARTSVLLSAYLFKITDSRGNLPRAVAEELIRARKRGVDVTVILEISKKESDNLNRENRHTGAILTRGGVKVFFDSPRVTSHAKVAVIDGRHIYLGSHNLTQSALFHNNELSLLVDSPELAAEVRAWLDRL